MTIKGIGKHRGFVYLVLAAFVSLVLPVGQFAMAAEPGNGSLAGFIYAKDMKTPVTGAVVKLRNLGDLKELTSPGTDENGMFTITGIPEGRYILGVTSGKDNFNFDYSMHIKAGELGKISVALAPVKTGQEEPAPASTKKPFFKTWAGRAVLIGAAGLALAIIFIDQKEASEVDK
jgi:hypothetical protein